MTEKEVIEKILVLFEENGRKLHTSEILDALGLFRDEGKKLSNKLDRFDIHPKNVRIGERVAKGYESSQFDHLINNLEILSLSDNISPDPKPRVDPSKRSQWIYAIEGGGMVKIGYSTSPIKRLGAMQTGSPVELKMIAAWHGTREDEKLIHSQLRHARAHGEWFARSDEVKTFIKPFLLPEPISLIDSV